VQFVKPNSSNGAYDSPIAEQQQKEIQALRASRDKAGSVNPKGERLKRANLRRKRS